ncbi:DUF4181 domain-containing protein [Paenibacillus cisolokensis]|uniref:DUF4181 domain-containing protein n=1 Tax=Paenibacillus cisolokensis TaxID=1658519 RepID=UPI003D297883
MHYHFSVVLFLAAVIQLILDITIRKTDEKISDTDGIVPYRWFFVIAAIVIILSAIYVKEPPYHYVWVGVLLALVFGVRALFEWRYIRSSQKHMISLSMMALSVIGTILYVFLQFQ